MFVDLDVSKVDINRQKIKGFPEIIYGEYKKAHQIIDIMKILIKEHNKVLVTRVNQKKWQIIRNEIKNVSYNEDGQVITYLKGELEPLPGKIALLSAGTSDYKVIEEARLTAEWMGCEVDVIQDIGVAGLGRLISHIDQIREANVVIAVAGMEGALPTVISGLIDTPLIAVPTSVGYGASQGGMTALNSMLTSCSSGITVVNIDNGFGAAYQAALILNQLRKVMEK